MPVRIVQNKKLGKMKNRRGEYCTKVPGAQMGKQ